MKMMLVLVVLLAAVVYSDALTGPRVEYYKDLFKSIADAKQFCKNNGKVITPLNLMLLDHLEERAKHTDVCGWTEVDVYEVECKPSELDDDGYCPNPKNKECVKSQGTSYGVYCAQKKTNPRVVYHGEDTFNNIDDATDLCKKEKHHRIAPSDQLLMDHKEKRAKHTECGWTGDGRYILYCSPNDRDGNGWCGHPLKKTCDKSKKLHGVYCSKSNSDPRAEFHDDDTFNYKLGRPGAFDHCWGQKNEHIASISHLLMDHIQRRAKHTKCGWTYERKGPYRVGCKDNAWQSDGWCKKDSVVKRLCGPTYPTKGVEDFGVYCNTGFLPEDWSYLDGAMSQTVMFGDNDDAVPSMSAAKELCEDRGMALAYSTQVAAQSARYDFSTQCQHCFIRKSHAVFSMNCKGNHDINFWVQDHSEHYCYICYGIPDGKYEHPCKKPIPVYAGKPVKCATDANNKRNGDIIIQNRVDCDIELSKDHRESRFGIQDWHQMKYGFSTDGEELITYWLGAELQHSMTQNLYFGLRIDITAQNGSKYCIEYDHYTIGPEEKDDHRYKRQYVMTVGKPVNRKVCSLHDQLLISAPSNGMTISGSALSTPSHDNDADHASQATDASSTLDQPVFCSKMLGNTCWWFNLCDTESNLNGLCPKDDLHDDQKKVARIWGADLMNFKESRMSLIYRKDDNPNLPDWSFDEKGDN